MSSSRLMDGGRATTETRPRIPTSVALILIGLCGMIFLCSALYWVGGQVSGMVTGGDTTQTEAATEAAPHIGPRDVFAVITAQDRTNCLARAYWQIVSIQTPTSTVYECHPQ